MSQHDLDLANQNFPPARTDISAFMTAISSQQSGVADPPTTIQFQYYADTTNNLLKRRNVGDSAYLPFDTLLDSRFETKVASYTHLLADMKRTIGVDSTAGDITVDLLDAAVAGNGFITSFKRIDASVNSATIDGFGGQTIDGVGTFDLLGQNTEITIISDGSNWFIISLSRPNPDILDRIRIWLDDTVVFNTGSYQQAMSLVGGDGVTFKFWEKFLLAPSKVQLQIFAAGSVSVTKTLAMRLTRTATAIFEELAIPFGVMDGGTNANRTATIPDLSTGHSTNLDLSITDMPLINTDLNTDSLIIEFRRTDAAPTTGTVTVPFIDFVLLK